jgi:hypothetical protein
MSVFEFVITLYSIVIALGVARVLTGYVGLIEFRSQIAHKLLFAVWLTHLLFVQIVWWFSVWRNNDNDTFSLYQAIFNFTLPACMFIAARLLVPGETDLSNMYTRYEKLRVPFLVFLALPSFPAPLLVGFVTGDWVWCSCSVRCQRIFACNMRSASALSLST